MKDNPYRDGIHRRTPAFVFFVNVKKPLSEKQIASIDEKSHWDCNRAPRERDPSRLKTDNIMIDRKSKEPVVMDFVCTRDEPNDVQLTQEGVDLADCLSVPQAGVVGGPHSDIYSMGHYHCWMLGFISTLGGIAQKCWRRYSGSTSPAADILGLRSCIGSNLPQGNGQATKESLPDNGRIVAQALTDFMRRAVVDLTVVALEDTSDSDIRDGLAGFIWIHPKIAEPCKKSHLTRRN
ncbi:MAG: hypothetical protein R3C12_21065 [Planctomycetaceae bacterium]